MRSSAVITSKLEKTIKTVVEDQCLLAVVENLENPQSSAFVTESSLKFQNFKVGRRSGIINIH